MASKQKPAVEWKKRISQEYKRLLQVKRLKRTVAVKVAWSTNLKKLQARHSEEKKHPCIQRTCCIRPRKTIWADDTCFPIVVQPNDGRVQYVSKNDEK